MDILKKILFILLIIFNLISVVSCTERYLNREFGFSLRVPDEVIVDNESLSVNEKNGKYVLRVVISSPEDGRGGLEEFLRIKHSIDIQDGRYIEMAQPVKYIKLNQTSIALTSTNWDVIGGDGFDRSLIFIKLNKLIFIELVYNSRLLQNENINIYRQTRNILGTYYRRLRSEGRDEVQAHMLSQQAMEEDIRNGNPMNVPQEYVELILKFDEIVNSLEFFDP